MKELALNLWFYDSFFFFKIFDLIIMYENQVFCAVFIIIEELWLWILRTALVTAEVLFMFLISAQHC
jgi:hypothetical protein